MAQELMDARFTIIENVIYQNGHQVCECKDSEVATRVLAALNVCRGRPTPELLDDKLRLTYK